MKFKPSHEENKKPTPARKAEAVEKKRKEDESVTEPTPTRYVQAPPPHQGYNHNYHHRNDNYNNHPPMPDSYARRTQRGHYDDGRSNNNYHPSRFGGGRSGRGGRHW